MGQVERNVKTGENWTGGKKLLMEVKNSNFGGKRGKIG